MNVVVGWVASYENSYPKAKFTNDRKKALIERIRKRFYNFTMFDHEYMPYCAPFYDDGKFCVLNKHEFEEVMSEVYKDMPRGQRLLPQDVITIPVKNGVMFEKEKFAKEGDINNG